MGSTSLTICRPLRSSMEWLAKSDGAFCLSLSSEGRLRLREDDELYYQVQGELNITKRQLCYFVGQKYNIYNTPESSNDVEFQFGLQQSSTMKLYRETSISGTSWCFPGYLTFTGLQIIFLSELREIWFPFPEKVRINYINLHRIKLFLAKV